jgi:S1-C subfamily serine protease
MRSPAYAYLCLALAACLVLGSSAFRLIHGTHGNAFRSGVLFSRSASRLQASKQSAIEARGPLVAALLDEIIERLGEDALESLMSAVQEDTAGDDAKDDEEQQALLNGVVRIYCTHSEPNFGMPWQRLRQECSSSSGFIIEGQRILTNAHAVEYGSLVQVKKRQCEKKYVAAVVAGE